MPDEIHRPHAALPVRADWFVAQQIDDAITCIWEPWVHEFIRCNIWHVRGSERDLLVDTGLGIGSLVESMPGRFGERTIAVATHAHYDHVGGLHEFLDRRIHRAEFGPHQASWFASLIVPSGQAGSTGTVLLSAVPHAAFEPDAFRPRPIEACDAVAEGDIVDLGDRRLMVMHLPGHSPGSVGLWEEATGILFSGDAIYEGRLFDGLPGSDITDYVATMNRLRELPVSVVHSGHGVSFGGDRLIEIADDYIQSRSG